MISVIIPLYNKEQIIEKSLKSVLSQDYDDFEVVIVNDGSTDRSAEIVKRIDDSRIRLIEQENGGPSKARNTGVKNAKGDWIVFLDADDELLPGTLFSFAGEAKKHPEVGFFAAPTFIQTENGRKQTSNVRYGRIRNPYASHVLHYFSPRTGNCLHKASLLKKNMFDEDIRRYEDVDFFFRMYRKTDVFLLPKPVMVENRVFASASQSRKDIKEDFLGHINIKGAGFWETMGVYRLFIEERNNYKEQSKVVNKSLYYRYDLLICYKLIHWICKYPILSNFMIKIFAL